MFIANVDLDVSKVKFQQHQIDLPIGHNIISEKEINSQYKKYYANSCKKFWINLFEEKVEIYIFDVIKHNPMIIVQRNKVRNTYMAMSGPIMIW